MDDNAGLEFDASVTNRPDDDPLSAGWRSVYRAMGADPDTDAEVDR